jgi:hypothetical protein
MGLARFRLAKVFQTATQFLQSELAIKEYPMRLQQIPSSKVFETLLLDILFLPIDCKNLQIAS